MDKSRIYIVDDHPVVREGLSQFIAHESDICVCGGAANIKTALKEIEHFAPDIVVTDLSLAMESGIRLMEEVRSRFSIPVLVLSMHDEALYAERCLKAGASGYVMKKEPPQMVIEAIRKVLAGGIHISRNLSDRIIKRLTSCSDNKDTIKSIFNSLTNRELEVFQLLGKGLNTRGIAGHLGLSVKTIEAHFANIRKKFQVKNMRELLKLSIRWELEGANPEPL